MSLINWACQAQDLAVTPFASLLEAEVELAAPLELPLHITGTLGEFRNSHYHYGLDLGAMAGQKVFAIDAGSVTRLMYQRYGIGYAIVVDHDNGRQSLYGHLSRFDESLMEHPALVTYKTKILHRQEFSTTFPRDLIRVKRSALIATSGATGLGPQHLHLSLIENKKHLNPLSNGLVVPDMQAPLIQFLRIVPTNLNSLVNGKREPIEIALSETRQSNLLANHYIIDQPINMQGQVRLQLAAWDPSGRSRLGLAWARMYAGQKLVYTFELNSMQRQNIFSHFALYDASYSRISYKSRYLHNLSNHLGKEVPFIRSQGKAFLPNQISQTRQIIPVEIEVADVAGNTARISLKLDVHPILKKDILAIQENWNIYPDQSLAIKSSDETMKVIISEDSVLEPARLSVTKKISRLNLPKGLHLLSPVYTLNTQNAIFTKPMEIYMQAPVAKNAGIYIFRAGRLRNLSRANFANGLWNFKSRHGGDVMILSDHVAPTLVAPRRKIYRRKSQPDHLFRLYFEARDIGTGVDYKKIKVLVDGKSALCEHDGDLNKIEIFYPNSIYKKGWHRVRIQATDYANNKSRLLNFKYRVR